MFSPNTVTKTKIYCGVTPTLLIYFMEELLIEDQTQLEAYTRHRNLHTAPPQLGHPEKNPNVTSTVFFSQIKQNII